MYKVVHKMKKVKAALKRLNDEGFSNIHCRDIQAYKKMITSQEIL